MGRLPDALLGAFAGAFSLDLHLVPNDLAHRLPAPDRAAA